jgi:hypothetical protein
VHYKVSPVIIILQSLIPLSSSSYLVSSHLAPSIQHIFIVFMTFYFITRTLRIYVLCRKIYFSASLIPSFYLMHNAKAFILEYFNLYILKNFTFSGFSRYLPLNSDHPCAILHKIYHSEKLPFCFLRMN